MFVSTSVVLSVIKSEMIWSLMILKQFVWKFLNQILETLSLHPFIVHRALHLHEFFLTFEKMIKMIDDENKELHILGDLNCNMLTNISNQPTKTLKGILETYQLSQLITEATRSKS